MMTMKRTGPIAVMAGAAVAIAIGGVTFAAAEQIKVIDIDAWGSGSSGGPFEVQPLNFPDDPTGLGKHGAAAGNFITFCVETTEFLGENSTYDVVINDEAVNGGSGGGSPDPLDDRTAFLFTSFMDGSLDDKLSAASLSAFTYGTEPSGADLQDAIWDIENEAHGSLSQLAQDLIALANDAVGAQNWNVWNAGIGNVRILNMYSNNGLTNNQDLLVLIPLPAPIMLGLAGLVGVGVMSARRRKVLGA